MTPVGVRASKRDRVPGHKGLCASACALRRLPLPAARRRRRRRLWHAPTASQSATNEHWQQFAALGRAVRRLGACATLSSRSGRHSLRWRPGRLLHIQEFLEFPIHLHAQLHLAGRGPGKRLLFVNLELSRMLPRLLTAAPPLLRFLPPLLPRRPPLPPAAARPGKVAPHSAQTSRAKTACAGPGRAPAPAAHSPACGAAVAAMGNRRQAGLQPALLGSRRLPACALWPAMACSADDATCGACTSGAHLQHPQPDPVLSI